MSGCLKQAFCCCPCLEHGTGGPGRKREAEDPAGVGAKGPGPGASDGWSSTETSSLKSTEEHRYSIFEGNRPSCPWVPLGCQAQAREQSQRAAAGKTEVAGSCWSSSVIIPRLRRHIILNAFEIADLGCHGMSWDVIFTPYDFTLLMRRAADISQISVPGWSQQKLHWEESNKHRQWLCAIEVSFFFHSCGSCGL